MGGQHLSTTSPSAQSDVFNAGEKQDMELVRVVKPLFDVARNSINHPLKEACLLVVQPPALRSKFHLPHPPRIGPRRSVNGGLCILPPCTAVKRLVGSSVTDTHCARPNCCIFSPAGSQVPKRRTFRPLMASIYKRALSPLFCERSTCFCVRRQPL